MTRSQWVELLKVEAQFKKRGAIFSRKMIQEAMGVTHSTAREWDSFLKHRRVMLDVQTDPALDGQRVGVVCDIHIPFQDDVALAVALNYLDKFRPDTIVILGDLIDFYKLSRFIKKTGKHSVREELRLAREFLTMLRGRFPNAHIIYVEGNHESHLERYILENAAEIADLVEDLLANKLNLHELGIEYRVGFFSIGKLWILHGHERQGGGSAEYITNVVFKSTLDHTIFGHHHRTQEKIFKRIDGSTLWVGGVGYLAGPMEYALLNNWNQGFATVTFNSNGTFRARLHKIQDGIIF